MKRLATAFLAAAALGIGVPANASVLYLFTSLGSSFGPFSFTYESPDFITDFRSVNFSLTSCTLSDCHADFSPDPNIYNSGGDLIAAGDSNATGFYFFQPGAFTSYGTYSTNDYETGPGFGNAGTGTLTVSAGPGAPAPEIGLGIAPALLAFGALWIARRRRRAPAAA